MYKEDTVLRGQGLVYPIQMAPESHQPMDGDMRLALSHQGMMVPILSFASSKMKTIHTVL